MKVLVHIQMLLAKCWSCRHWN